MVTTIRNACISFLAGLVLLTTLNSSIFAESSEETTEPPSDEIQASEAVPPQLQALMDQFRHAGKRPPSRDTKSPENTTLNAARKSRKALKRNLPSSETSKKDSEEYPELKPLIQQDKPLTRAAQSSKSLRVRDR